MTRHRPERSTSRLEARQSIESILRSLAARLYFRHATQSRSTQLVDFRILREKPLESHRLRLEIQPSRDPHFTPGLVPNVTSLQEDPGVRLGLDPPRERWDKDSRQLALGAALLRGHHKFAKKDEEGLAALLINDVTSGCTLLLLMYHVRNIPANGKYHPKVSSTNPT